MDFRHEDVHLLRAASLHFDTKLSAQINSQGGLGSLLATDISPQLNRQCTVVHDTSAPPCWTALNFDTCNSTSGVATPIQMGFGETGPGVLRGPGYWDIDSQPSKKFFIKKKYAFEIGAQAFNTLNHPNFSTPSASVTSGTIGTITGDISPPTSPYGAGQGAIVTGRVLVVTG